MTVQAMYAGGKPVKEVCKGDIVSMPFDAQLRTGTTVYKTFDHALMKELYSSFEQHGRYRKVPVSLRAQACAGKPFIVTLLDEDANIATAMSDYVIEAAKRKATSRQDIQKQLDKLGNTAFEAKLIEIGMAGGEEGIFIPIKEMNDTRSKAVAELERIRTEGRRRERHVAHIPVNEKPSFAGNAGKPLLAVSVSDMESLHQAISCDADLIYYDPEPYGRNRGTYLQDIAACVKDAGVPAYLHTPLIVKDQEMHDVEQQMLTAIEAGFEGIIAANPGVLRKALSFGIRAIADSSLNIFNREAASVILKRGAELIVLSPEMNLEQVKGVSIGTRTECVVHGRLLVMESEHSVIAALTGSESMSDSPRGWDSFRLKDEKDFVFPVRTDSRGRTHIFNSKELCLLEDIPRLVDAGISRMRIDARMADPSLTGQVVGSYRDAIDSYYDKRKAGDRKCRDVSEGFTRGHYHRGVL
jgi:putative protease